MQPGSPSRTAEVVCWIRASEQARPRAERVVDDPYAAWFLGPLARAALAYREATGDLRRYANFLSDGIINFVLARHRYIDDCLRRALAADCAQVVLLGAGYDTRAYRFARPLRSRTVYEVDHPATSRCKARIVTAHAAELPKTAVRIVEVDFQNESFADRLLAAGFASGARTFFVWEGVAMYLSRPAVKATLKTLATLAGKGSELAMDLWTLPDAPDLLSTARRLSANALALVGEPVTFALHPEDATPFLRRHGFRVREIAAAPLLERRYFPGSGVIYPSSYVVHAEIIVRTPRTLRAVPAARRVPRRRLTRAAARPSPSVARGASRTPTRRTG